MKAIKENQQQENPEREKKYRKGSENYKKKELRECLQNELTLFVKFSNRLCSWLPVIRVKYV
jgi:hypothetical protein